MSASSPYSFSDSPMCAGRSLHDRQKRNSLPSARDGARPPESLAELIDESMLVLVGRLGNLIGTDKRCSPMTTTPPRNRREWALTLAFRSRTSTSKSPTI